MSCVTYSDLPLFILILGAIGAAFAFVLAYVITKLEIRIAALEQKGKP